MASFIPDVRSEQWNSLKEWLNEELMLYYNKLAATDTDADKTQQYRGAVIFIKKLLSKETARPAISGDHVLLMDKLNGR